MNYFITLEATSTEAYKTLMSFLDKEALPISELGITPFENNYKTRKKANHNYDKILLSHFDKIKQTVITSSTE